MTTYTRRAAYGFAWIAFGAIIANLFAYLLRLLLVRNLTVEEYGLIYAVLAFFGLFGTFQHMGLGESLTKFISKYRIEDDTEGIKESMLWALGIVLLTTICIALPIHFFANWIGLAYFKSAAAPDMIRTFAFVFILNAFGILLLAILQGFQKLDLYAIQTMLQSVLLVVLTYFLIPWGLRGVMYAYVVMYLILYIIMWPLFLFTVVPWLFKQQVKYRWDTPKNLLSYGFPVMLTGAVGVLLTYTDTVLLTWLSTLYEVGIYQAALPTANMLLIGVTIINVVMFPLVAEMWVRKQRELIRAAVHDLYKYVVICALPIVILFIIYPAIILNLLFGGEYAKAAPILALLAVAALFLVLNAVNMAVLSGTGMPANNTKTMLVGAILNILLNLMLIPQFGGIGSAVGTLLAAGVMFMISGYFVIRELHVRAPYKSWLLTAVAGMGFVIIISGVRLLNMNQYMKAVLGLFVAITAYFLLVILLGVVTRNELRVLRSRF